jgi:hypothetical protein
MTVKREAQGEEGMARAKAWGLAKTECHHRNLAKLGKGEPGTGEPEVMKTERSGLPPWGRLRSLLATSGGPGDLSLRPAGKGTLRG